MTYRVNKFYKIMEKEVPDLTEFCIKTINQACKCKLKKHYESLLADRYIHPSERKSTKTNLRSAVTILQGG